jgi:glycosyltransferase involved in cell wall biosynthesis
MRVVEESAGRAIRVGVNAHLLSLAESYRSAGINWYIYNLLHHLPEMASDIEYTVFTSERRYTVTPGIHLQVSRLPTDRPPVRILWEQALQPWAVRRAKLDLLHSPAFVGPLFSACPLVVTVHDLSFLFFPQSFRTLNRSYLRLFTWLSVRRAQRVLAVSESTKRDLVQYYGLSPAKVDVVYNGVDSAFRPLPAEQVAAFRRQAGLPERFMLFVGTLEPRKNVVRLIEAYARLPKERPPLVLVGGKGWLYEQIFAQVEALNLSGQVHFAGYVLAEDLPLWYNAADLFVYPSLYEGFGLPPLEAMACGTAVITSTASSLPEVVGKAGLAVDPTDTEALATAMGQMLIAKDLREQMQAEGLAQAQKFSWAKTARCTVGSYRRALISGEGAAGV